MKEKSVGNDESTTLQRDINYCVLVVRDEGGIAGKRVDGARATGKKMKEQRDTENRGESLGLAKRELIFFFCFLLGLFLPLRFFANLLYDQGFYIVR